MADINSVPSLLDILNAQREEIFSSLNCHAIGKIEEFNHLEQTAKVSIEYQRSVENMPSTKSRVEYPVLLEIPVIVLGGGNGSIRFPIKSGDNCIVLFNDRDIDGWLTTGSKGPLASDRKHSFSDGIALVGIRSMADNFDDYDPDRTELVHSETKISLSDKIRIKNAVSDLYTVMDSLVTILNTLAAGVGVTPGNPIYPGLAVQVALLKIKIDNLLEV